jgi:hypothetical protein
MPYTHICHNFKGSFEISNCLRNHQYEQVDWKEGVELDLDAKKGVITLRPKDEAAR